MLDNDIAIDEEKTKELVAYLAAKVDVGKTKLMKLLYLVDFTAYEELGKSVTKDQYCHWNLGPVPRKIWHLMKTDFFKDTIVETEEKRATGVYQKFSPKTDAEPTTLSKAELRIVDDVIKEYGQKYQADLVQMLHEELPFTITDPDETIPYFLAPYRNYKRLTAKQLVKLRDNQEYMDRIKSAYRESRKESSRKSASRAA